MGSSSKTMVGTVQKIHVVEAIKLTVLTEIVPQTVLALWGSGVFKGWWMFPARARFLDTQNHEKKPTVFKLFHKKWCWRSSFEVHLFIFWWMLRLILLFLIKNCLWVTRSPKGYQGGIWAPWLVVCKSPTSWLVVCKPPTSWLGRCFITNEVFWRFPELRIFLLESEKRDLQF